jgi:hypothetical protein
MALLFGSLLVSGCLGAFPADGKTDPPQNNGSATGGGGDAGAGAPSGGSSTVVDMGTVAATGDMATTCIAPTTARNSGEHNAGAACLDCHQGGDAPKFTFAGTLFDAVTGGAGVAGATVEAVDAQGQLIRIVTSANGNFYTAQAVTFPLTVRASSCPSNLPMISKVQNGNCNSSGCHASAMQAHLP